MPKPTKIVLVRLWLILTMLLKDYFSEKRQSTTHLWLHRWWIFVSTPACVKALVEVVLEIRFLAVASVSRAPAAVAAGRLVARVVDDVIFYFLFHFHEHFLLERIAPRSDLTGVEHEHDDVVVKLNFHYTFPVVTKCNFKRRLK